MNIEEYKAGLELHIDSAEKMNALKERCGRTTFSDEHWWKNREADRILFHVYKPLPYLTDPDFFFSDYPSRDRKIRHFLRDNFAHLPENEDIGRISLTIDQANAVRDRQTSMRVGRVLARIEGLGPEDVRIATERMNLNQGRYVLQWAEGEEEILHVYRNCDTGSCMSHGHDYYSGIWIEGGQRQWHPVRANDTPDIQVAYLIDTHHEDQIVARAVTNKLNKSWTKIYGVHSAMYTALSNEGYEEGSLIGCRLKTQMNDNGDLILPYVDGYGYGEFKKGIVRIEENGNIGSLSHYDQPFYEVPILCNLCDRYIPVYGRTPIVNWEIDDTYACHRCIEKNPKRFVQYHNSGDIYDSYRITEPLVRLDNRNKYFVYTQVLSRADLAQMQLNGALHWDELGNPYYNDISVHSALSINRETGEKDIKYIAGNAIVMVGGIAYDYDAVEDGFFDDELVKLTRASGRTPCWVKRARTVRAVYNVSGSTTIMMEEDAYFDKDKQQFISNNLPPPTRNDLTRNDLRPTIFPAFSGEGASSTIIYNDSTNTITYTPTNPDSAPEWVERNYTEPIQENTG